MLFPRSIKGGRIFDPMNPSLDQFHEFHHEDHRSAQTYDSNPDNEGQRRRLKNSAAHLDNQNLE